MRRFAASVGVGPLLIVLLTFAPLALQQSIESERGTPLAQQVEFGTLPLAFEANAGQADPVARFLARAPGGTFFFTPAEIVLALDSAPASPPAIQGPRSAAPPGPDV